MQRLHLLLLDNLARCNSKKTPCAFRKLGFTEVYEVALGADIGAVSEAHHYADKVATKELPFLLTSCCPSWSMMAKKFFPDMIENISQELTPMVATARTIKKEYPDAEVVFIVLVHPRSWKHLEKMCEAMWILLLPLKSWLECLRPKVLTQQLVKEMLPSIMPQQPEGVMP